MIALLAGYSLVGVTAACVAALARFRGVVAFALAMAVIGSAEVIAVSHALSLVDAYRRDWFLVTVVALAVVAMAIVVHMRPGRPRLPREAVRELAGDCLLVVLSAVVALELAYLFALAVFTPPTERDVTSYHLTRALLWIQRHAIERVPEAADARINDFPVNAETLQGGTMLLSDSVRWVGLVQFAWLLVAVLAIYGIGRRIGMDRREAAFGALLFATLPVVGLQAPAALNDLMVASLVAVTAFFALGKTRADIAVGAVAVALLVGTKGTALLALPVLLAVVVIAQRRRRLLGPALVGGLVGVLAGGAWYGVNLSAGNGLFGYGGDHTAARDGVFAVAARGTRYVVETIELPGGIGRDRLLYAAAAGIVLAVMLVRRRPRPAIVASLLTLGALLVLPLERLAHDLYWNGWKLVGYDEAVELGTIRDPTVASNVQSWYGPVGLAATLVALILVVRARARREAGWLEVILVTAPLALLVATAVAVGYFDFNGRFVMGGVALSAATWGVLGRMRELAIALTAVTATTVGLMLVNYTERPSGIDLLGGTHRPSIWTLPREWAQSTQPELAVLIGYADDHVPKGAPVALANGTEYPFAYAGYPRLAHEILLVNNLRDVSRGDVEWAVSPLSAGCTEGWRLVFRSPPAGIFHRVAQARCSIEVTWALLRAG